MESRDKAVRQDDRQRKLSDDLRDGELPARSLCDGRRKFEGSQGRNRGVHEVRSNRTDGRGLPHGRRRGLSLRGAFHAGASHRAGQAPGRLVPVDHGRASQAAERGRELDEHRLHQRPDVRERVRRHDLPRPPADAPHRRAVMRPLRLCVSAVWFFSACSKPPPPPPPPPRPATPVSRAVEFLMSQEEKDGRWKSGSIATLGSGQALTPFVLYALSHAPEAELAKHRAAIDRALDLFPIAGNEYPSYSLALSILALQRLRPTKDVSDLRKRLKSMQLAEDLGWTEEDPEYGAWD